MKTHEIAMTIVSAFLAFEILYVGFYTFQFADRLSVNILLGAIIFFLSLGIAILILMWLWNIIFSSQALSSTQAIA
jgi:small-conductance mechanosensitive channel